MIQYFQKQINYLPEITQDVLDRVEYKTVWSGKRIQVGDKVLYAYVYIPNTDDLKLLPILERELMDINNNFNFVSFDENEMLPILSFKSDTKKRG